MNNWFKFDVNLTLLNFWLSLSTPDFTIENPEMRPCLWPKWKLWNTHKNNVPCECHYMFYFNWFFHLMIGWGKGRTYEEIKRGI